MMQVLRSVQVPPLAAKSGGRVQAFCFGRPLQTALFCKNDAIGAVKTITARPMAATVAA